jgi:hypothetical protein
MQGTVRPRWPGTMRIDDEVAPQHQAGDGCFCGRTRNVAQATKPECRGNAGLASSLVILSGKNSWLCGVYRC